MHNTDEFQSSYCKSASEFGMVSQQKKKTLIKGQISCEVTQCRSGKDVSAGIPLLSFSGILSYRKLGDSKFGKSQQNLQAFMKLLSSEIQCFRPVLKRFLYSNLYYRRLFKLQKISK